MIFAVYGKKPAVAHLAIIGRMLARLEDLGAGYIIYEPFYKLMSEHRVISARPSLFNTHAEVAGHANVMLSMGGDGTFLDTVSLIRDSGIPVLGINIGKLGFLSSTGVDDMLGLLREMIHNGFSTESRTLLCLESPDLFGDTNFALNDIVTYKKNPNSLLVIHAAINGQFLNSYWADGLIIATPTGSTAYSMSCGGPIIMPHCNNFVITPIATHNLTVRPFVIPDDARVSLRIEGKQRKFHLSLDSHTVLAESGSELIIRRNDFCINLVRPADQDFCDTIRKKLNWGLDARN